MTTSGMRPRSAKVCEDWRWYAASSVTCSAVHVSGFPSVVCFGKAASPVAIAALGARRQSVLLQRIRQHGHRSPITLLVDSLGNRGDGAVVPGERAMRCVLSLVAFIDSHQVTADAKTSPNERANLNRSPGIPENTPCKIRPMRFFSRRDLDRMVLANLDSAPKSRTIEC